MLKFPIKTGFGSKIFNFPTNVDEITNDYLQAVTDDVVVANNYVLVALCYREKLATIIMTANQRKNGIDASVIPLFVKKGNTDNEFVNSINVANKLIISGSDLALGYHVSCPKNTLNIANLLQYIKEDNTCYQRALQNNEYIHFVEFKIIPANNIVGIRENIENVDFKNPFAIESNILGDLN